MTLQEVEIQIRKSHDDPLAIQYWSGYRMALIETMPEDRVIRAVCNDLRSRSEVGIKKYGVTLERKDLSLDQWLEHAYTEALDMANYLKRTIMELRGEL